MLAFHKNRFVSLKGAAEHPSGGVACISLRSLMRRFKAAFEGAPVAEVEASAVDADALDEDMFLF
jgi:hypothetical protein